MRYDWCIAQFAKALGKHEDEAYFSKLAHNYGDVFNPAIGNGSQKRRRKMGRTFRPEVRGWTRGTGLVYRSQPLALYLHRASCSTMYRD